MLHLALSYVEHRRSVRGDACLRRFFFIHLCVFGFIHCYYVFRDQSVVRLYLSDLLIYVVTNLGCLPLLLIFKRLWRVSETQLEKH
jgi:hypothetical protein